MLDEDGRPCRDTLIEIWQANAAGRYIHEADQHDAPLDPNFLGAGRCVTDDDGRYRFFTIKPGAYPWRNHPNAWRPNHIHFSLFGPSFATRLVTQMYFPGDPLLALDPIFQGAPEGARERLIAALLARRDRAGLRARLRLRHRAARPPGDADGDLSGAPEADAVADRRARSSPTGSRPRNTATRSARWSAPCWPTTRRRASASASSGACSMARASRCPTP